MPTAKQIQEIQAALVGYPRQLRWEDFAPIDELPDGVEPEHDAGIAMDFKVTQYFVTWGGKNGSYLYKPQVTVILHSSGTWATARARTDKRLLAHEQGHFDVTGLIARDLAASLVNMALDPAALNAALLAPAANPAEFQQKVQRVNRMWKLEIRKAVDRAQALARKLNNTHLSEGLYDFDTSHGTDREMQKAWDALLRQVKLTYAGFEATLLERGWLDDPRAAAPPLPRAFAVP